MPGVVGFVCGVSPLLCFVLGGPLLFLLFRGWGCSPLFSYLFCLFGGGGGLPFAVCLGVSPCFFVWGGGWWVLGVWCLVVGGGCVWCFVAGVLVFLVVGGGCCWCLVVGVLCLVLGGGWWVVGPWSLVLGGGSWVVCGGCLVLGVCWLVLGVLGRSPCFFFFVFLGVCSHCLFVLGVSLAFWVFPLSLFCGVSPFSVVGCAPFLCVLGVCPHFSVFCPLRAPPPPPPQPYKGERDHHHHQHHQKERYHHHHHHHHNHPSPEVRLASTSSWSLMKKRATGGCPSCRCFHGCPSGSTSLCFGFAPPFLCVLGVPLSLCCLGVSPFPVFGCAPFSVCWVPPCPCVGCVPFLCFAGFPMSLLLDVPPFSVCWVCPPISLCFVPLCPPPPPPQP